MSEVYTEYPKFLIHGILLRDFETVSGNLQLNYNYKERNEVKGAKHKKIKDFWLLYDDSFLLIGAFHVEKLKGLLKNGY